jgi:hypothetical protein
MTTTVRLTKCLDKGSSVGIFQALGLGMLAIVLCLSFGCNAGEKSESTDAHEEHFPPHWPETIFVAADRLAVLESGSAEKGPDSWVSLEQQWVDLFRWLPELAADSELSKNDFDRIDAISLKHGISMEKMLEQGKKLEQMKAEPGVTEAIATLQQICRQELQRLKTLEQ